MYPWPVLINNQITTDPTFAKEYTDLNKALENKKIKEKEYMQKLFMSLAESTSRKPI